MVECYTQTAKIGRSSDVSFHVGELIEELRGTCALPLGIKHPNKLIPSLVDEGQLARYAETRGQGNGRRYTFRAP